jgi:iron complex outermembrane receptor protein
MYRSSLLRGASAGALALVLSSSFVLAQESLPTIDIAAEAPARARASGEKPGSSQNGAGQGGRFTGYTPDFGTAAATTKDRIPVLQNPASIKIVPRQLLDDKQSISLEDALIGNVAGVQSISNFYDQFVIRGFPVASLNLRNNLRVYNYFAHIQTGNLQSIEVLKGPASLFYGRFEPGGIINLVPKRPLDTPYYSIQQQTGSWGLARTTIDATGPITDDKTWLYRLNLTYNRSDSFRDFITNQDVHIAPTLSYRPNEQFRFNLDAEYQNTIWVTDSIPTVALYNRPAPIPISRYLGEPSVTKLDPSREERYFIGYDWTYDITPDWSVTNRFAFSSVGFWDRWTTANKLDPKTGVLDRYIFDGVLPDRQALATNLDVNGQFDTGPFHHTLVIGADYLRHRETSYGYEGPVAAAGALNIYAPSYYWPSYAKPSQDTYNYYSHQNLTGIYAQDYVSFLDDKVHLLFGGRHDWVAIENGYSAQSLNVARLPYNALLPGEGSREAYDTALTPRLGAVIQPEPWVSLYFSYSRSFGATNALPTPGRPNFPPQRGLQYEAGAKAELLDGRLTATVSYFDIYKSGIVQNIVGTQFSQPVGVVRSTGAELELAGRIDDHWSVTGTFAHMHARIVDDQSKQLGNRLMNAPFNEGALWLKYDADGDLRGLSVAGGFQAVGDRQGDNNSSFQLPSYAIANFMAMYRWQPDFLPLAKNLALQLNIRNLTDETYYTGANSRFSIIPGAPRTFLVSLRAEF